MSENQENLYKVIHIGKLLKERVVKLSINESRICAFFSLSDNEINNMYNQESIDSNNLLMWSKLLEYDFFRIYSQHLILYSPPASMKYNALNNSSKLPVFKKKIYTKEIVDFLLELINTKQKTKKEIIDEYGIPKTTLYKWVAKYGKGRKEL